MKSELASSLQHNLSPTSIPVSRIALVVKKKKKKDSAANAGDLRNEGSIPGSERLPVTGNGNPLQYSCLENPIDRGGWQATVHGVAKSQKQLK